MSKKQFRQRKDRRLDPDYQEIQLELAPAVLDAHQYDLFAYPVTGETSNQKTQAERVSND